MAEEAVKEEIGGRIPEQEEASDRHRDLQQKFEDLIQTLELVQKMAGIGYWSYDLLSKRRTWSRQMFTIFGFDPKLDPPINDALKQNWHPDDWDLYQDSFQKALKGKPYDFVIRLQLPENRMRCVHTQGYPRQNEAGNIIGLVGTCQDITERKEAEDALRTSEEKYRNIYENSVVGLYQSTPQGRFLSVNAAFAKMLGYASPEDLVSSISDIATQYYLNPEDRRRFQEVLKAKGHIENFEFQSRCKDGSPLWVSNSTRAYFDSEGRVKRYEGIVLDITQRKQAEAALLESEELYRDLVENSQDLICTHNLDGQLLSVNQAASKLTGYTQQELLRKNLRDLLSPKTRHLFGEYLDAVKTRGSDKGLMRIQTKSGKERIWEYWNTLRVDGVSKPIVRGMAHDVTDRVRVEKGLKQSEAQYREFFDEVLSGAYISEPGGKLVACNPEFARIFGFSSPTEAMEAPLETIYTDPSQREAFLALIRAKKSIHRLESEMRRSDGSVVHVLENAMGVFDESGNLIRIRGFLIDITELKTLESQLRQSQKLEAIGGLAGGVAHEFNNMLAIILGNSELALMEAPEWSPALTYLHEIQAASLRARDIVRHVLTFARKAPAQVKPIQIVPVVREAMKLMRATIPAEIEIQQDISCGDEVIMADPTEIHQVVMNLCANGASAMAGPGVLTVGLKPVTLDEASAPLYEGVAPGKFVKLTVSDTGSGIPPELLDRIFEPFFTTKEVGKGTGMGLAVVYGIVKRYGGAVAVESTVNKGSVFQVLLPRAEQTPSQKPANREELPLGTERILFVDDEVSITRLVVPLLERQGYQVTALTNSLEALERFKAAPDTFDLVISDIAMPHMAGDRLAQELLKIRPDVPIVLCTGHSERMDEKQATAMGILAFMNKPLSGIELSKTIRKVLDEAKPVG